MICSECKKEDDAISKAIGVCVECLRKGRRDVLETARATHAESHRRFGLPAAVPRTERGARCSVCANACSIGEGQLGFCGVRKNSGGNVVEVSSDPRLGFVEWYHDFLPTNCVGDWVCPGGSDSGYPEFSHCQGPERGYKNLAVFYCACSFDCLFCQNWHFRRPENRQSPRSIEMLADAVDETTSCICFFGGDPTPQVQHALQASRLARKKREGEILRICWETNGSMHRRFLEQAAELSFESGGCVKFDLKAWSENVHVALTGVSNRQTLANFRHLTERSLQRPDPPFLIASTLLVPGYIDETEVSHLARFLAELNPAIPYTLLGYYPHFYMNDLPRTSWKHAQRCAEICREAGLLRVKLGNPHLFW
jgi:pyruvate formate lyase activating enzyme